MRQGQVLPREELKKALWSDGVCGNLDRSLTRAMNKVRVALGDTADNPRFIETLPRRGYRFVAPVSIDQSLHEQGLADRKPTNNSPLGPSEPSVDIGVSRNKAEVGCCRVDCRWRNDCDQVVVSGLDGVHRGRFLRN